MLRDRYRQWGINDKNQKRSTNRGRHYTVAAAHENADVSYKDQWHGGSMAPPSFAAGCNLRLPFHIPKQVRLLQQTLKSIQDWQLHFKDSGGHQRHVISAVIWLRTHIRSMRCAIHCLENSPSLDQSALAFRLLRETSIALRNKLRVKCSPPAVLISMFTLLKVESLNSSRLSIYHYTSRTFFLRMAAEMLPRSHPTLLLLQLLACDQTPNVTTAICRVGRHVVEQCLGPSSEQVWVSQLGLTNAATGTKTIAERPNDSDQSGERHTANTATSAEDAGTRELAYVNRLRSLSGLDTQSKQDLREAYGAYQLLAVSQHWLGDFAGEGVSLRNALKFAETMDLDAGVGPGDPSLEVLQAVRELYCYYEIQNDTDRCQILRLDYPSPLKIGIMGLSPYHLIGNGNLQKPIARTHTSHPPVWQ